MKKYLILFIAVGFMSLASCSNEDDSVEREKSLLATWTLVDVSPEFISLDCPNESTITFNSDGTTSWELYSGANDCELEASTGMWEKLSENKYVVTIPQLAELGEITGTVAFSGENKFTFTGSVPEFPVPVTLTFEK